MEDRVIMLGDFYSHSLDWNLHCVERIDTAGLEALIERYDMILNNEPGKATRYTRWTTTFIIDLTFTTEETGRLDSCIIDEELSTPSDYKVIVCDLPNLDETVGGMRTSQVIM